MVNTAVFWTVCINLHDLIAYIQCILRDLSQDLPISRDFRDVRIADNVRPLMRYCCTQFSLLMWLINLECSLQISCFQTVLWSLCELYVCCVPEVTSSLAFTLYLYKRNIRTHRCIDASINMHTVHSIYYIDDDIHNHMTNSSAVGQIFHPNQFCNQKENESVLKYFPY